MFRRHLLLAAPAILTAGSALAVTLRPIPSLDDAPLCRGAFRPAYMEGRPTSRGAEADADVMEALGLLEGHLIIGRALVDADETKLGLPHFGHPVSELYDWLEPRLTARSVRPFKPDLEALEQAAKAGTKGPALDPAYATVMTGVAALRATIQPSLAASTSFQLRHMATMMEAVAGDYGASIERGRITNILEYHDSAGFLRYALAAATPHRATPGWTPVLAELESVRDQAYPTLLPPQRPPVSITAMRARAATLRRLAEQI